MIECSEFKATVLIFLEVLLQLFGLPGGGRKGFGLLFILIGERLFVFLAIFMLILELVSLRLLRLLLLLPFEFRLLGLQNGVHVELRCCDVELFDPY